MVQRSKCHCTVLCRAFCVERDGVICYNQRNGTGGAMRTNANFITRLFSSQTAAGQCRYRENLRNGIPKHAVLPVSSTLCYLAEHFERYVRIAARQNDGRQILYWLF